MHNSEPLPYIDEERESRSGLRQSLKAEPMDDEYDEDGEDGKDGEEDDEIDAFEPEVEIIEPKKKRKKTRKVLQSQPLKP